MKEIPQKGKIKRNRDCIILKFLGCPICKNAVEYKYEESNEITNIYCQKCKKPFEVKNLIVINKTKKKIGN